jgi:hypothetical protein
MMQAGVETSLRPGLSREDLSRIYHLAFKTELDRIIVHQAAKPMLERDHAEANLIYARLFTMLARCVEPPHPDVDTAQALMNEGLSAEDAYKLHEAISRHRASLPISANQIGAYLVEAGVYANDTNKKAVGRVVAAAYRNACLEGSEALGNPIPPGTVWPLPGNLMGLIGIDPPRHDALPLPSADLPPAPRAAIDMDVVPTTPPVPPVDIPPSETITMIAAAAIAARVKTGEWDKERARDVNAAVKLFVAANGDISFASIQQRHLAAMVALFPRLPNRYGFARKNPNTGKNTQETIEDALARGDALRVQWSDPVGAEEISYLLSDSVLLRITNILRS